MADVFFDQTVANVVEGALDRFSKGEAMIVTIKIRAHHYLPDEIREGEFEEYLKKNKIDWDSLSEDEKAEFMFAGTTSISLESYMSFLFYRPSNYTLVLQAKRSERFFSLDDKSRWTFQSDHDSCWRSDGLRNISKEIFKLRDIFMKKIQSLYEKYGLEYNISISDVNGSIGVSIDKVQRIRIDSEKTLTRHAEDYSLNLVSKDPENRKETWAIVSDKKSLF